VRHLRALVPALLLELLRFARGHCGAGPGGSPYIYLVRWVRVYGPEVHRRLYGELKRKSSTWHMDETYVGIAGKWMYLFRAVDSRRQMLDFYLSETRDREAAKLFLERALTNPDNQPPQVFARDGLRSYASAIRELQADGRVKQRCRQRTRRYCNNRIESDHSHIKRRLRCRERGRKLQHAPHSRDRGRPDDTKGPGARNNTAEPPGTGLGLRYLTRLP
jgi:transposase-like protein